MERAEAGERRKQRRVQLALVAVAAGLLAAAGVGVAVTLLWRQAEGARDEAVVARDEAERAKAAEGVERQKAEDARQRLEVVEYGCTVQVAYQEWKENNVAAARALLDSTQPELRGWEWHHVHRLTHAELVTVDEPNPGGGEGAKGFPISYVGFTPDGSRLVTSRPEPSALFRVWDASTGRPIRSVLGKNQPVSPGGFSPDGSKVIATTRGRRPRATQRLKVGC